MNGLYVWAISPEALKKLLDSKTRPTEIPADWFNWSYQNVAGGFAPVHRLMLLPEVDQGVSIERWYAHILREGYTANVILTMDDIDGIHTTVQMGDLYLYTLCDDTDEAKGIASEVSGPEDHFYHNWNSIRCGEVPSFVEPHATPSQWRAYAEALWPWYVAAMPYIPSKFAVCCRDFLEWSRDHVQFSVDDFVWPDPHRVIDHEPFIPLKKMHCCGITLDADGNPKLLGMLTPGYEWDMNGSVRKKVLEYRHNAP